MVIISQSCLNLYGCQAVLKKAKNAFSSENYPFIRQLDNQTGCDNSMLCKSNSIFIHYLPISKDHNSPIFNSYVIVFSFIPRKIKHAKIMG